MKDRLAHFIISILFFICPEYLWSNHTNDFGILIKEDNCSSCDFSALNNRLNYSDSTIQPSTRVFMGLGFLGKGLSYPLSISAGMNLNDKWSVYVNSLSPHLAKTFLRFSAGLDYVLLNKKRSSFYAGLSITYAVNRKKMGMSDEEYFKFISEKRITSNDIQFFPDNSDTRQQWFYVLHLGWKMRFMRNFIFDPHVSLAYSYNKDLQNDQFAFVFGFGMYYNFPHRNN